MVDKQAKKIKEEKLDGQDWENINKVLYYWGFIYILKIIEIEIISWHPNNLLVNYFGIEKI